MKISPRFAGHVREKREPGGKMISDAFAECVPRPTVAYTPVYPVQHKFPAERLTR
jgi:hypothetical protein